MTQPRKEVSQLVNESLSGIETAMRDLNGVDLCAALSVMSADEAAAAAKQAEECADYLRDFADRLENLRK